MIPAHCTEGCYLLKMVLLQNIIVAWSGNIIGGFLDLAGSIYLVPQAYVTIEIKNALGGNIVLNNATLM